MSSSKHDDARTAIRNLLEQAHVGHSWTSCTDPNCGWIPLPAITRLPNNTQHSARIFELRHDCGLNVQNRQRGNKSWFRLVAGTWEKSPRLGSAASVRARHFVEELVARDDAREKLQQQVLFSGFPDRHIDLG
jgi:hypothetical protein